MFNDLLATCQPLAYTGYNCICPNGFTGVNCGSQINACVQNPCLNNGVCSPTGNGEYTCACLPGLTGKK